LLTVDNGKQFDLDRFKEFCHHIGTKIAFASVYHPESNGAVERENRIIFSTISKTLLNLRKGNGLTSYLELCGLITQQSQEQPGSPRSSSCMGKRRCCPKKSNTKACDKCTKPYKVEPTTTTITIAIHNSEVTSNLTRYAR